MSWQNIPGFSADIEVYYGELAKSLPQGARFVEVGVLFGRSIGCIGTLRPDLDLWAVDTWDPGEREGEMAEYQARYGDTWAAFLGGMRDHCPEVLAKLHVIRSKSTWVDLPFSDVVFLDADHSEEAVRADIIHWRRLVRPGGILAGHDYLLPNHPGVVAAVDAILGKPEMGPGDWTSVWVVKQWSLLPAPPGGPARHGQV